MKTEIIAFDLDGVFVNHPPLIPKKFIEMLYKSSNNNLSYRIPGKIEQKIRILSHTPLLRPKLKKNIKALVDNKINNYEIYIISSRFSFLKVRTDEWIKKNDLSRYFKKMYFNYKDEQPHLFKERMLRENRIEKFVDDDLDTLIYLSKKLPGKKFYWLSNNRSLLELPGNIVQIKTLKEILS